MKKERKQKYIRTADLPEDKREARRAYLREYARARALDPAYRAKKATVARTAYQTNETRRIRHIEIVRNYNERLTPDQQDRTRAYRREWAILNKDRPSIRRAVTLACKKRATRTRHKKLMRQLLATVSPCQP